MKKLAKTTSHLLAVLLAFSLLISCDNESKTKDDYKKGVFIINEGGYGNNNGSLSFYNYETDSVYNSVFEKVNERSLGDVVQSLTVAGNKAYIVVNNSNKVEVIDKNTIVEQGVIEGLNSPRYMIADGNTGYISCWGNNLVMTVDLNSLRITDTIFSHGAGPEKMLLSGSYLYVLNSGGRGSDSTVSVFETATGNFVKNIAVPHNPMDIVEDIDGNIWVLSMGKVVYDTSWAIIEESPSILYKINPQTNLVSGSGPLFDTEHPMHLELGADKKTLFVGGGYTFGGILKIEYTVGNLNITKISNDYFYAIHVDPASGEIFATQTGNYTQGGTLKRLTDSGRLLGTYTCGIGTSGAAFKEGRVMNAIGN